MPKKLKKNKNKKIKKTRGKKVIKSQIKKFISQTGSKEEKVEIKKIKKQPSEKRIYSVNNYVVYPKHGVGKIVSVDSAKIGNIEITF